MAATAKQTSIKRLALIAVLLAGAMTGGCGDKQESDYGVNATIAPSDNQPDKDKDPGE